MSRYTKRLRKAEGKTNQFKRRLERIAETARGLIKEFRDHSAPIDRPRLQGRVEAILKEAEG